MVQSELLFPLNISRNTRCVRHWKKPEGSADRMFFFTNALLVGLLLHRAHGDEFGVALPSEMEVWRGSCLTIPCSFTVQDKYRDGLKGQCAAVWMKAENFHETVAFTRATSGNVTQNNCTTTVHDISEQQAGKVFFRVECDNPLKWTFTEKSLNIKVKEAPPAPALSSSTLSVTEGQSVVLQCSAPAPCPSAPPALTWSSVPGDVQETLQQQQDGTFVKVSTLSFTAAASDHDRSITCSAAYSRGSGSVSLVSAALRPAVKYRPRNTAVSLKCSSDANPAAEQHRWYKAERGVHTLIGKSSVLDVKASENVGQIFCEAQNELGTGRSVALQLNQHFSARILRSSSCTGDSSQMSCVCEAEGNPPPQMHWRFSGISTNTSIANEAVNDTCVRSVVTVTAPQWRDPVALVCHSSNSRGSDTQTFTVPAFQRRGPPTNTRVTVSPPGPVAEHADVTLTCSSEAHPAVELYGWYKDDGGARSLIGNSAVLNIKASKDATAFLCQSQNELGADVSAVARLNVQYSPRNTTITGQSFGPVVEHDNVTLTCSSDANPAVQHYRWYKADGGASSLIGNSAVINLRASKDSAQIFCEALNDVGTDRSAVTQLLINYGPRSTRVTVDPQSSVREHSHVSLTCSSDASPAVQHYRWYKDHGGARTVIGNSAVLTMSASKDTAAVFCQAHNHLGNDNSTFIQLDVQYSPRNTTISGHSFGPVVEHDNVTLTCSSDANPAVQHYRWYKADGGASSLIGNSAVINLRASKDSAQIFCEALNDAGTDRSAVTQLLINYGPRSTRVTVDPQSSVREHSHVSLTCSSDASPAVQHYRWYKDHGGARTVIGNSAVLTMNASKDTTAVFCQAHNHLGNDNSTFIQLDVQYQPRNTTVSVTPRGPVDEHSDVTVTCSSDANPAVQHYRWYKADGGASSLIGNSAVINLRASKDSAQIFCEALNDVGTDRSAVTQLLINYGPRSTRVTVDPQSSVREHSHVSLTCSSDASPAVQHYRWYKDHGGARTVIGNSAVLTMNASKDTTAVFCQAHNHLGNDNSTFIQLDVQYQPQNTTVSVTPRGPVDEHSDVTVTCSSDANPAVQHYRWYKADGGASSLIGNSAVINLRASKDSAQIFCEALNDVGTDRSAVTQLLINYGPRSTRVTVDPQSSVREHSHVSLTCSSDASPAVQHYRWYKDHGGARTVIGNSAVLTMNASKDTTAVFCQAHNHLGTDNSTFIQLDVQYSPRNTTVSSRSSGPVVENDDVTLSCSSDAGPAARLYRWYKAEAGTDTHIGDSALLTMKASKDTTRVFCEALNDLGSDRSAVTHLDVRYDPRNTRVTVSPSGPVLENHLVTLKCSSEANPGVQRYSWFSADGGAEIGNSPLLEINASKNITRVFCRAQNDLGTDDSAHVPLDVQFSPQILLSSNCTEDEERIRCWCEAEGNPVPVIQWHLPGISSNHSISSEPLSARAMRSIITFSKAQSRDLLTLLCHSSSSLGTSEQLLYTQASQKQHGSEAGPGAASNLLIVVVFFLLVLVAVLLFVVRNQNVRLRESQSKLLALDRTPESNELEEETEMNIYTNANQPPAEQ